MKFKETRLDLQEMIKMQQSLEQDSLSSSQEKSTQNGQENLKTQIDEDDLSFMSILKKKCETSSMYSLLDCENPLPAGISYDDIVDHKHHDKPKIKPYAKIKQIKGKDHKDGKSKLKPAIEVGISIEF